VRLYVVIPLRFWGARSDPGLIHSSSKNFNHEVEGCKKQLKKPLIYPPSNDNEQQQQLATARNSGIE
jgi:hypothetical protein